MSDFLVPDLGEGLEELTILNWLVQPGDQVTLNQPLCLVETAKAEVEIPSPYEGVLQQVGGAEGETLRVGTLLARFGDGAEATAAPDSTAPDSTAATKPQPTLVGYGHDDSIDRSRRGRRRSVHADAQAPAMAPTLSAEVAVNTSRPLAKPPVRKLARDLGVDLVDLAPGSGDGGIITRDDVRRAADNGSRAAHTAPVDASGSIGNGKTGGSSISANNDATDRVLPVTGVRARIAERMSRSRQKIPDATCSVVADFSRLIQLRASLNEVSTRRGQVAAITPFSLVCRLAVQAMRAAPTLNATFVDEVPEIRVHAAVHLGVGTATERGLVVAVVRDAQARSTSDLANELARLAQAARGGTLAPADMVGSTFTVSNFGALGLDDGIPVINHPEAAILGVGSVKPRPHVVDGQVVARPTGSLTLAFDHRVCDGAEAARFLVELRSLIESPELALFDS